MFNKLTPEEAINVTWLSVALTFCWPLPPNSSRVKLFGYKVIQVASIINGFMLLAPLLYAVYLHSHNVAIVSGDISLCIGVIQIIVQTIICIVKHDNLQRVINEMVTYVKEARQSEREIFCKYITKCDIFYASSIACMYLTATAFSLGPVFMSIPFPADAVYPFRVNYTPVYVMVYMHQFFLSYQCAAHTCLSMFGALLFWFSAARFECLAMELRKSTDVRMLVTFIKKQLHLRKYAVDVVNGFRFIILFALLGSLVILCLVGFIFLLKTPLVVKIQFLAVFFTLLTEIYVYAWSADNMKDMSINVSQSAYEMTWYDQSLEMQKIALHVLQFQNPVILSISCILPEFTLRYYCSYLSNAFSIFTALRAVIQDM
ncbi:PREDICTED: uncharacterized protein LOC108549894 [Eufriesea mexicana]|uniref:uncharacterized protein LOC108549894 n=1 Tax=Eufriesea mexicana TaxID=516756 RepID=UPI00083C141D|nr:PREDICTED: uncharacterized protein LOC108549894 [Eufriesea mexicana]